MSAMDRADVGVTDGSCMTDGSPESAVLAIPRTWGYPDCPDKARAWQAHWLARYAERWIHTRGRGWSLRDGVDLFADLERQVSAETDRQRGWHLVVLERDCTPPSPSYWQPAAALLQVDGECAELAPTRAPVEVPAAVDEARSERVREVSGEPLPERVPEQADIEASPQDDGCRPMAMCRPRSTVVRLKMSERGRELLEAFHD